MHAHLRAAWFALDCLIAALVRTLVTRTKES